MTMIVSKKLCCLYSLSGFFCLQITLFACDKIIGLVNLEKITVLLISQKDNISGKKYFLETFTPLHI